jgi:cell division protein FtsQ
VNQTRIRRGGTSRLSSASRLSGSGRKGGRGALKRQGAFGRFLAALPVSDATLQRIATFLLFVVVAGSLIVLAVFFGLPGMMRDQVAILASRAGFQVEKVEVHGTRNMDDVPVYSIALGEVDRSMLNIDLPKLRAQMLKLPWVSDARISRRLPDTLVVDIVERKPVAVWQHDGHLALIDVTGAILSRLNGKTLPDLPLVVGPHANMQAQRLATLMESAPSLKPVLVGATWVGNRRWDLRFQSGETLSLPEGDREAAAALVSFTRMDGVNRLLGRGIVRFDMRDPDKFVLRLPKKDAKEGDDTSSKSDDNSKDADDKATALTAPSDEKPSSVVKDA